MVDGIGEGFNESFLFFIFDRLGKRIAQINFNGIGWDGTFNGSLMEEIYLQAIIGIVLS